MQTPVPPKNPKTAKNKTKQKSHHFFAQKYFGFLGKVAQTCDPSYLEVEIKRITV
jgi:hypothetical protein